MTQYHSRESWAVVGGGFLGMTLALRLAQQGKTVTLVEAAKSLGGLASAWQIGDLVWDRHYHVILRSDTHLRAVLRELGLEDQLQWRKVRTGFFVNSKLYSMSNMREFLEFPPLNLWEKFRLGTTILRASRIRDSKTLEQVPVEDWLERWSGPAVTQKIWLPLLRSKLGDGYRDVSAAFIWTTIARMYAARRTGAKSEMFGYIPGGYARILENFEGLLRRVGVRLSLGEPVRAIAPAKNGELEIETSCGRKENFTQVVVTAAAGWAGEMCPALTAQEKDRLARIKYQGIICASLLLKNSLSPFYITNITDAGVPYTAVIEMSTLVDKRQFGGRALVYLPKYLSPDSPYFHGTDEQIREDFVSGLERMYPQFQRKDVLCFQISRVKHLLPIPTINYSANALRSGTSIPGLYIVNSSQIVNGTLNVNEIVRLADAAAQRFTAPVVQGISNRQSLTHELVATAS